MALLKHTLGTQVLRLRSFKFDIGIAFRCHHCYEDIGSCLIYRVHIISIFPNEPDKQACQSFNSIQLTPRVG